MNYLFLKGCVHSEQELSGNLPYKRLLKHFVPLLHELEEVSLGTVLSNHADADIEVEALVKLNDVGMIKPC